MWTHLENHHKVEFKNLTGREKGQTLLLQSSIDSSQTTQSKMSSLLTSSKPLLKNKIDRLIADMIIIDLQPYSIVEDQGFLALLNAAFPHYKVPSRQYFTYLTYSHIDKLYQEKLP